MKIIIINEKMVAATTEVKIFWGIDKVHRTSDGKTKIYKKPVINLRISRKVPFFTELDDSFEVKYKVYFLYDGKIYMEPVEIRKKK